MDIPACFLNEEQARMPLSRLRISLVRFIEGSVKGDFAGWEIHAANESCRFFRAVDAIHANVFPFDRERTFVSDIVERDDDVLEFDVAMAKGTEVPKAA